MNKRDLIAAAGSPSKLAEILGLTRQAVSDWGELVPELQQYRIRDLRRAWFRKGGKMHPDTVRRETVEGHPADASSDSVIGGNTA